MMLHYWSTGLRQVCLVIAVIVALPACTDSTSSSIEPSKIPLGDGKISTAGPAVGYVFACSVPSSSNPPGKAPWISADGLTWDSVAKLSVQGSVQWASSFTTSLIGSLLNITGNGLPNHPTGSFPIARTDPAYQYDKNPNTIQSIAINWGLTSSPVVAARPTCLGLGAIGVMYTGARLFNALDADGRDAVAHEVQDGCGGHPQSAGNYHYHDVSKCINQSSGGNQHSLQVGVIADGFGLYGNQGEGGQALTNADLDECHGHVHLITVNGAARMQYHYHATKEYPYTVGCFKGTPTPIH
jgi:YHYH protein